MPSIFRKILPIAGVAAAIWLAARFAMPVAMPFVLAAATAFACEPLVCLLNTRLRLPRPAAAGIGVSVGIALLGTLAVIFSAFLLRQIRRVAGQLPDLRAAVENGSAALRRWMFTLAEDAPAGVSDLLRQGMQALFSDGSAIFSQVSSRLMALATGALGNLSASAMSLTTWLLASFMLSARLPRLRQKIPAAFRARLARLKKSVFGFLRAQSLLLMMTVAVLLCGLSLLRVRNAGLYALLIGLVDALPVFGCGTVLVPWSVVCLLQGDTARALGLLGSFAVATLLRMLCEPKLVGSQLGLDPLVTLFSMYAGYRLLGIGGLLVSPLLAVTAVELLRPEA